MMSPRTWTLATLALLLGAGLATAQAEPLPSPFASPALGAPQETSAHAGNHTNGSNGTLPPPSVSPSSQYVTGPYGSSLAFSVTVENVADETQRVTLSASAPVGWRVVLGANNTTLAPGAEVVVSGTVTTLSPLPAHGNVTLHVRGRDAGTTARIHACFSSLVAWCPSAGGNGTGGNNTGGGHHGGNQTGNHTGGNQTGNHTGGNQTGGNQTGGNQTGGNSTSPPANDTQQAEGPEAAPASRPESDVRVEVVVRTRLVRTAWTGQGSVPSL